MRVIEKIRFLVQRMSQDLARSFQIILVKSGQTTNNLSGTLPSVMYQNHTCGTWTWVRTSVAMQVALSMTEDGTVGSKR